MTTGRINQITLVCCTSFPFQEKCLRCAKVLNIRNPGFLKTQEPRVLHRRLKDIPSKAYQCKSFTTVKIPHGSKASRLFCGHPVLTGPLSRAHATTVPEYRPQTMYELAVPTAAVTNEPSRTEIAPGFHWFIQS